MPGRDENMSGAAVTEKKDGDVQMDEEVKAKSSHTVDGGKDPCEEEASMMCYRDKEISLNSLKTARLI